jgi:hypothetical protein
MAVKFRQVASAIELEEILRLRYRIFALEFNEKSSARDDDAGKWHDDVDACGGSQQFAVYNEGCLIATARLTHRKVSDFPGGDVYRWRQVALQLGIPSADAEAHCFLVDRMVVEKEWRDGKLRIGSNLLDHVIENLPAGCFAICGTKNDNVAANKMLGRCGWTLVPFTAGVDDSYAQYFFHKK